MPKDAAVLILLAAFLAMPTAFSRAGRPFTVRDDIELAHFATLDSSGVAAFSPNGRHFIVATERGRVDLDRPETTLRVFRTTDVQRVLQVGKSREAPSPVWTISNSTWKEGPIITSVKWASDSTGFAFVAKTEQGLERLLFADITRKDVQELSEPDQYVTGYDIRGRDRFVYSVLNPRIKQKFYDDRHSASVIGTGRTLNSLMGLQNEASPPVWVYDLSELWVVSGGRRKRLLDQSSGLPIPLHLDGERSLSLSPDGRFVLTALTVNTVPSEWEGRYPSGLPSSAYRLRAGNQDSFSFAGQRDVSEYVSIDVATGAVTPLLHAPLGNALGWWGLAYAGWSSDAGSILLFDTFLGKTARSSKDGFDRPCVVIVKPQSQETPSCVVRLEAVSHDTHEVESRRLESARFVSDKADRVLIEYSVRPRMTHGTSTYTRAGNGAWLLDDARRNSTREHEPIRLAVKQGVNAPPVLMGSDNSGKHAFVLLDPNPQLKDIDLGSVSAYHWNDESGRAWDGGLYKPTDYVRGQRYPLVIQNHGFSENEFSPSGASTTGFAAQELAAVGIVVLQVRDCSIRITPEEGPCQVKGYESSIRRLADDGVIDPSRVGIIGFSRTCFYVMEALTTSSVRFKAASITDGIMVDYVQYLMSVDTAGNAVGNEFNSIVGAPPFGDELKQWIRLSPLFNIDRVTAPLLVVAGSPSSLPLMWGPYAAMRYLHKPVDLIVLNSGEHALTNPAVRMASQGGSVDWFRFWLQDYEDPDPSKALQYVRWRELRKLRDTEIPPLAPSSVH